MSQDPFISGIVTDSIGALKLPDVVISVIRAKDSILMGFARTDSNGYFKLEKKLLPDNYLLMAGLSSYVEYIDEFTFAGQSKFFQIALTSTARMLQAVIVGGHVKAIRGKAILSNSRRIVSG